MSIWTRIVNRFRKGSLDREFHDELRFHLELRIARNAHEGMPPAEAEAEALRQFGNTSRIKREMQEVRVMKTSSVVALAGVVLAIGTGAFVWLRGGESSPQARYYRVSDDGITSPSVIHEQKPNYPQEAMGREDSGRGGDELHRGDDRRL